MDQMEDKLASLLGNPDMMQKIMSMAQALGASQEMPQQTAPAMERNTSEPDLAAIQKIMSFVRQTSIDRDQQNLLNALKPYLPQARIAKLEKAMRAARLAALAASTQP